MEVVQVGSKGVPWEVRYTEEEGRIRQRFDDLLDQGWGIPQAAVQALNEGHRTDVNLDPKFIADLGEGFVTLTDSGVAVLNEAGVSLVNQDNASALFARAWVDSCAEPHVTGHPKQE